MPWKAVTFMEQKKDFLTVIADKKATFTEICFLFNISRKTGYKWLKRYDEFGDRGLIDRRSTRISGKSIYDDEVWRLIIDLRRQYPFWGSKKLLAYLRNNQQGLSLPGESRVKEKLKQSGLMRPYKRRSNIGISPIHSPLKKVEKANDTWSVDYKGWFKTKDNKRCEPLTLLDNHSRYLLGIKPCRQPNALECQTFLIKAFQKYGQPDLIRSDNGAPFGSSGLGSLTPVAVWLLKIGVYPEKVPPGKPYRNGRLERFHRTLKVELLQSQRFTFQDSEEILNNYLSFYNQKRPHDSLPGGSAPGMIHEKSNFNFTGQELGYDYHGDYKVLKVSSAGYISLSGSKIYLTESLINEYVGLEKVGEDITKIWFRNYPLALLKSH